MESSKVSLDQADTNRRSFNGARAEQRSSDEEE